MTTVFSLEQNFFKLFNLPLAFDVDISVLKSALRALQRQYHPDKFVNAAPQEQRLAVQFSAHLNSAFTALQNPVSRAEHMLGLLGLIIEHQSHTVKDTSFLMEQMDLREDLSAIKQSKDTVALQLLKERVLESYQLSQKIFKDRFESVQENTSSELNHQHYKLSPEDELWFTNHIGKMHFYEKLSQEIMR